tara:strand:- start:277 stop:513 length:237 start_codon:yes stop_codon:yes gene_type:complete
VPTLRIYSIAPPTRIQCSSCSSNERWALGFLTRGAHDCTGDLYVFDRYDAIASDASLLGTNFSTQDIKENVDTFDGRS